MEGSNGIENTNDLEPLDTLGGAAVGATTLDGLYLYSADKRRAAARWLYQTIYDKAHDEAGFWGTLFTDAPDDVANQICNAFASDWVDGDSKDSDDWKNTGAANAVSPNDIMFWDSPSPGNQGGFRSVYGYREEIFFQPGTYAQVPVYRWKIVPTRGTLTGTVVASGQSPSGADVSLQGSGAADFYVSDDGHFQFDNIPEGDYSVTAGLNIGGHWYSATGPVHITAGKSSDVTLVLQPPPAVNRLVTFSVHMDTTDPGLFDTDTSSFDMRGAVRVGPFHSHEHIDFDGGSDTPRGHIGFDIDLNPDLSVTITWTAQEIDDEVEDTIQHTETIEKDETLDWEGLTVCNPDPIDSDYTTMRFTITNDLAPA